MAKKAVVKLNSNAVKAVGKQKRRKKRKHRAGPKRALSAYMYFVKLRRPTLKTENPNLDNKQLVSKLGALWRGMNDKQKKKYTDLANQDKKRYDNEKKTWVDPDPQGLTKKGKKTRKPGPKRALSAYMYYVKLERLNTVKAFPKLENKQIVSKLGEQWRGMSDKQKKKYTDLAAKDKKRYEKEKADGSWKK